MYIDKFGGDNPNEIIDEIIDASFNESGRHGKNLRLNLSGNDSPSVITVKMKLDKDEMFGFNVKVCVLFSDPSSERQAQTNYDFSFVHRVDPIKSYPSSLLEWLRKHQLTVC